MSTPAKFKLRTLDDLDQRTNAAHSARALISDLQNDLGGADVLSAGMRELIKRTALVGGLCEDLETRWVQGEKIDIGHYALLANAQRRLLATIGLDRRPRDVTPAADRAERRIEQLFEQELAR
jgi:hypothetical protein